MSGKIRQETIRLLDKEYNVACPEDERDGLLESARMLDTKMREIHTRGKIIGNERIVVMAALNLIFELMQQGDGKMPATNPEFSLRLRMLTDKLDSALSQEDRQLTL